MKIQITIRSHIIFFIFYLVFVSYSLGFLISNDKELFIYLLGVITTLIALLTILNNKKEDNQNIKSKKNMKYNLFNDRGFWITIGVIIGSLSSIAMLYITKIT